MTKGRKAKQGQSYKYKGWNIVFNGTDWEWGSNIQRTLSGAKRVIDANQKQKTEVSQ